MESLNNLVEIGAIIIAESSKFYWDYGKHLSFSMLLNCAVALSSLLLIWVLKKRTQEFVVQQDIEKLYGYFAEVILAAKVFLKILILITLKLQ